MLKALPTALLSLIGFALLDTTPAQAQININIGTPPPQYVVVREVKPAKKWKGPKHKKGAVLLVPAGPAYQSRGRGRH